MRLKGDQGGLRVVFENMEIELRPRAVIVRGGAGDVEGAVEEKKRGKKYIYISLREPPRGLGHTCGFEKADTGGFEARVTDLGFAHYLTIVTPGPYLYDYIVVTDTLILVTCSGKKSVYVDREDDVVTLYFA